MCVVEQPKDLLALEAAGAYRGVYHVLLGRIAPLEGIDPDDLTIGPLMDRLAKGEVREVIMGLNPNLEGDGTALHIQHLMRQRFPDRGRHPTRPRPAGREQHRVRQPQHPRRRHQRAAEDVRPPSADARMTKSE